jgi:HD superfamily phosphohydrolase
MPKSNRAVTYHEIRDPIHAFVKMDSSEAQVVNSRPYQRLRYIHQLALTSLVYPAATHKRFEHCLGVMELAGRVYDTITNPNNLLPEMRYLVPRSGEHEFTYWRRVVRMAALCHDLGHLPFSHAAEHLLPKGHGHEEISRDLIQSDLMKPLWTSLKINPRDVAKIAVGAKHHPDRLDEWESILSEIIIGDTFGVDRMDYLLRDSHHVGVAYGRFDHFRLIDTIRILPKGDVGDPTGGNKAQLKFQQFQSEEEAERLRKEEASKEPTLGIESGGLQSAEGLLWARQFMWSQVYLHHTRQVYDSHLADFLSVWLEGGQFSIDPEEHLKLTDNEVMSGLLAASRDKNIPGHEAAICIIERRHFRRVYEVSPSDKKIALNALELIYQAMVEKYGAENVKMRSRNPKSEGRHFPVLTSSGQCESSTNLSETFQKMPVVAANNVYIHPDLRDEAKSWLGREKARILASGRDEEKAKP